MIDPALFLKLPFFEGAEPHALGAAARESSIVIVQPGATVFDFGDRDDGVYCIVQGVVRVAIRTASGLELVLGDLDAGQLLGEMAAIDQAERSASATALVRSVLYRMPGECFLRVALASPPIGRRLLRLLADRVRAKDVREMELTALPVRFRLCADLLRLARSRADGSMVVSPPPPQHVLGARIGARREAVSRELAALTRLGLVQVSRRAIALPDPARLRGLIQAAYAS